MEPARDTRLEPARPIWLDPRMSRPHSTHPFVLPGLIEFAAGDLRPSFEERCRPPDAARLIGKSEAGSILMRSTALPANVASTR